MDGGTSWQSAELGDGPRTVLVPAVELRVHAGAAASTLVMARATNRHRRDARPSQLIFNPAGYHNNVVQRITIVGGMKEDA